MSNAMISILVLEATVGTGVLFIIAAILINLITVKNNVKCTQRTIGKVIKYKSHGSNTIYPVVEFIVNGKVYTTRKKFNGYKSLHWSLQSKGEIKEDDKGYLCIKRGAIVNLYTLGEQIWPLGKMLDVFYCEDNPKINFVERPIKNSFVVSMFIITGICFIFLGLLMIICNII